MCNPFLPCAVRNIDRAVAIITCLLAFNVYLCVGRKVDPRHLDLCAESAVGVDPLTVLLADDFLMNYKPGVTLGLGPAFTFSEKSQFPVKEIDGPDISRYGFVMQNSSWTNIEVLVEKPDTSKGSANLAYIGRYVLTNDIFEALVRPNARSSEEVQLVDAINIHVQQSLVETVTLNSQRYDSGSVDVCMRASYQEYQKRW